MAIPPFDVTIKGVALSTYGFTGWDTYDGLGLVSDGLIWSCQNIWWGPYYTTGLTTVTTTWAAYGASITTSWTVYPGMSISTVWTDFSTYNVEDC